MMSSLKRTNFQRSRISSHPRCSTGCSTWLRQTAKTILYYRQFNTLDQLNQVVVFYVADQPVACGAIKAFDEEAMEVKRMYTILPHTEAKGLATRVLGGTGSLGR
jgi:hypothetical protein